MFYAANVGRELAPATENGTFSDFPKENKMKIACGDVILRSKITGGSFSPALPYYERFGGVCVYSVLRQFRQVADERCSPLPR